MNNPQPQLGGRSSSDPKALKVLNIINEIENHLHKLTELHLSIAPMDYMREVKVSTSLWMNSFSLN
jgi:hypothetical protein